MPQSVFSHQCGSPLPKERHFVLLVCTLPKTNYMDPEDGTLNAVFPLQTIGFRVHVSFRWGRV